jgi:hypothetical protein
MLRIINVPARAEYIAHLHYRWMLGRGGLHSQTLAKSAARFSSVDEFEPQRPSCNMRNAWANMSMIINAIHPIAEIYRLSHASRGG